MIFKSQTPPPEPQQVKQTHIHQSPSIVGPIFAKASVAGLSLIACWFGAIYLLAQAGAAQPAKTLSQWLIVTIFLATLVFIANQWFDKILDHRLEMTKELTQQHRLRQLYANKLAGDTRQLGDQQRLANLVYLVMTTAYDQLHTKGPFTGTARPWSSHQAGQLTLAGESAKVGRTFAAQVRPWLEQFEIISGDQINTRRYPDIHSIQHLLFLPPVAPQLNGHA